MVEMKKENRVGLEEWDRARPTALDYKDRIKGALWGLAVGDALGAPYEFDSRDSRRIGSLDVSMSYGTGGTWNVREGEWTDDTAMALCGIESLLLWGGLNPDDLLRRWVAWWRKGYMSTRDECFDIGTTTSSALLEFRRRGLWYEAGLQSGGSGNGSLMRLAPFVLWYAEQSGDVAVEAGRISGRLTHGSRDCDDSVMIMSLLMEALVSGEYMTGALLELPDLLSDWVGAPGLMRLLDGSVIAMSREQVRSGGYCVDTLVAAVWSVLQSTSFSEAVVTAIRLGGDTDTVAAVVGQLAGLLYGCSGIPRRWIEGLLCYDRVNAYINRFTDVVIELGEHGETTFMPQWMGSRVYYEGP